MQQLPPEFDPRAYLEHESNRDIANLDPMLAGRHYIKVGRDQGRVCSAIDQRSRFQALVQRTYRLLEIGPWYTPAFQKASHRVQYLDAFSTEYMRRIAVDYPEADPQNVPEIDFVWQGEPYADLISRKFDAVFSSHNVEHQPCLLGHFADVASILRPGGRLFLAIPDKRFCFDHFLDQSSTEDVLDAYAARRRRHTLRSQLQQLCRTTHNDSARHWRGDHGSPGVRLEGRNRQEAIRSIVNSVRADRRYIDTHAWQFTPESFRAICDETNALGFCEMRVERVYETLMGSNEFYAILTRPS